MSNNTQNRFFTPLLDFVSPPKNNVISLTLNIFQLKNNTIKNFTEPVKLKQSIKGKAIAAKGILTIYHGFRMKGENRNI